MAKSASKNSRRTANKLFVVRKYIKALDAAQAIRMDKKTPVHDCYVDDEWARGQRQELAGAIGFTVQHQDSDA
jgi:hypothetical protein